jgi:hypothetical protein
VLRPEQKVFSIFINTFLNKKIIVDFFVIIKCTKKYKNYSKKFLILFIRTKVLTPTIQKSQGSSVVEQETENLCVVCSIQTLGKKQPRPYRLEART